MKILLLFFVQLIVSNTHAQNGLPANDLLNQALAKAKQEKKNVFVMTTATWCGPCKELKKGLHDVYNRQFFEDNYVILELYGNEVGDKKKNENAGVHDILVRYKGDTTGIPYWFILNPAGVKLADSYIYKDNPNDPKEKATSGFSSSPEPLKAFIKVIKKTSHLNDMQLQLIYERFQQLTRSIDEDDE